MTAPSNPSGHCAHVCDNEPSPGSLVLGLPVHDGAVHVVGVSPGGKYEEQRSEAEEDVHQGGDRALVALGESDGDNTKEGRKPAAGPTVSRGRVKICGPVVYPPWGLLLYIGTVRTLRRLRLRQHNAV